MGLCIEAYQRARLVRAVSLADYHVELETAALLGRRGVGRRGEAEEPLIMIYDEGEPASRRAGTDHLGRPGTTPRPWSMTSGLYDVSSGLGKRFSIGGYSYFNWWRVQLVEMVDGPLRIGEHSPFGALLMHTDSDGHISGKYATLLFQDFVGWWERAQSHAGDLEPQDSQNFMSTYVNLMQAFDLARTTCRIHEDCVRNPDIAYACAEQSGLPGGVIKFS